MRQRLSTRPRRRLVAAAACVALTASALAIVTGTAGPAQAVSSCQKPFPGVQSPTVNVADGSAVLSLKSDDWLTPNMVTRPNCNDPRMVDVTFTTPYVEPNEAGFLGPKVPYPRARIILPAGYTDAANATAKYPVLYLLHGGGVAPDAGYKDWTSGDVDPGDAGNVDKGHAYSVVKQNPDANTGLIVVMVEGSALGQYADWYYSTSSGGSKLSPRYESFIAKQLVQWVDKNLRTRKTASGAHNPQATAIAGYSMGGFGALNLSRFYPGLFNTVAGFSAVTDIKDDGTTPFGHLSPGFVLGTGMQIWDGIDPSYIFGPTWQGGTVNKGSGPLYDKYNPIDHVNGWAGKDLWLSTGSHDPAQPKTAAARCDQGTAVAAAESAICVGSVNFDAALTAQPSTARPATYRFVQTVGATHGFSNWNPQFQAWLPHALTELAKP